MHSEKDDIERLFSKKFEKFEVKSSEEEWLDLSSKLSKSNFLKFSFASFNLYYLLVLVTFAGTATFSGIRNIQLSKKVQTLEYSLQSYQKREQSNSVDTKPINPSEVQKPPVESVKPNKSVEIRTQTKKNAELEIKVPVNKSGVKTEPLNQAKPEVKEADIKQVDLTLKPDSATETKVRKVIKKTLVVKSKTVIVKDTVVIKKSIK